MSCVLSVAECELVMDSYVRMLNNDSRAKATKHHEFPFLQNVYQGNKGMYDHESMSRARVELVTSAPAGPCFKLGHSTTGHVRAHCHRVHHHHHRCPHDLHHWHRPVDKHH